MSEQANTNPLLQEHRALRLIAGSEVDNPRHVPPEEVPETHHFVGRATLLSMLAFAAIVGFVTLFATGQVRFGELATAFPVDVLAILVALDVFSRFVAQTGALDAIGFKLARATKGRSALAAMLMGLLMFGSSAMLNNLAAIFVLAPIFLTLLRAMRAPASVTSMFLALMLVLCNLGGMATPMGDFPAILLMSSGLVGFTPYLLGAFPLALSIALMAIIAYAFALQRLQAKTSNPQEEARTRINLSLMDARTRHVRPDLPRAIVLSGVFVTMVLAWALVSPEDWPFFMTAVVGVATAAVLTGPKRSAEVISQYDLKTLVIMMTILAVAALVSVLGVVGFIANALVAAIPDSAMLLIALMILVTIAAGMFSAGPATAAVLPIFISLSEGPLSPLGDLIGVAFAASICAGSSMFMHSATAGPTLRGEVVKAGFVDDEGRAAWGAMSYFGFGLVTAMAQLGLSITWILLASTLEQAWLLNLLPLALLIVLGVMIWSQHRQKSQRSITSVGSAA
ncbi:SLC13 family permease [Primorskyibacter flagellatus]|uniref:Na+/H+ antiporter NhaD n=1 Tax=Primorskyibacter flagellatus TaxID=1387277 RepID=A0A1W2DUK4_9RHOB|nr:SLC13 family permease [Primorskyibacter flagellatus]SMD01111.1 Na+/H+ antiporter NhaD [Primorskyibacter flagellatus]